MRKLAAASIILLLPTAGHAEDPTFNGLFEGLRCNFQHMVLCDGAFCQPVDRSDKDLMTVMRTPLDVNFAKRTLTRDRGADPSPIDIQSLSEAVLGAPLWARFTASPGGQEVNVQTTYIPRGAQGYRVQVAMQTELDGRTATMSGVCSVFQPR